MEHVMEEIELGLTIHILHVDMIHMPLLKWVGLGSFFSFPLWTISCVMPLVPAFEARYLTKISLHLMVVVVMSFAI